MSNRKVGDGERGVIVMVASAAAVSDKNRLVQISR